MTPLEERETDCGHGLHQKYATMGGFVCLGCDPSWQAVPMAGLYSLLVRREPMTEQDWQDTEA